MVVKIRIFSRQNCLTNRGISQSYVTELPIWWLSFTDPPGNSSGFPKKKNHNQPNNNKRLSYWVALLVLSYDNVTYRAKMFDKLIEVSAFLKVSFASFFSVKNQNKDDTVHWREFLPLVWLWSYRRQVLIFWLGNVAHRTRPIHQRGFWFTNVLLPSMLLQTKQLKLFWKSHFTHFWLQSSNIKSQKVLKNTILKSSRFWKNSLKKTVEIQILKARVKLIKKVFSNFRKAKSPNLEMFDSQTFILGPKKKNHSIICWLFLPIRSRCWTTHHHWGPAILART